ncbi:MAG: Ldh family oxidoreductase [Desulfovibrionaceae bacterium]|nr:Ldh family oxidoreductase [Desulfovibrionaceae bacterium]
MPVVDSGRLRDFTRRVFLAIGAPQDKAAFVATRLVHANLTGHASHGVLRINQYVKAARSGDLVPGADPAVAFEGPAHALVTGNRGFGQVCAAFAVDTALRKAGETGLALVGCRDLYHVGRLGDYTAMAAEKGFLALAFCNGGGPNVAPFGGRERIFGTNPLACSVPGRDLEIDFASASIAEGKLNVARNKSATVGPGLIQDKRGLPTADPNDFYDGGSILPMGGHKGSALALFLEIMGGVFTGARCSVFPGYKEGNGVSFLALKPDLFRPKADFDADMDLLCGLVAGSAKAEGAAHVLLPGEIERENLKTFGASGVELDERSHEIIGEVGASLGVFFDQP